MAAAEVVTATAQLSQTLALFSCAPCAREAEKKGILRRDYLVLQLEGHLLRVTGVFDRALVLVNEVLQLGNPPENCVRHVILKNCKVRESAAMKPPRSTASESPRSASTCTTPWLYTLVTSSSCTVT